MLVLIQFFHSMWLHIYFFFFSFFYISSLMHALILTADSYAAVRLIASPAIRHKFTRNEFQESIREERRREGEEREGGTAVPGSVRQGCWECETDEFWHRDEKLDTFENISSVGMNKGDVAYYQLVLIKCIFIADVPTWEYLQLHINPRC